MKKNISIITIGILVVNLVLRGMGLINDLTFWVIIALGALISYLLKKSQA